MVKFDDKSHPDYKNLENLIVRMMQPPRLGQSKTSGAALPSGQSSFMPQYVNFVEPYSLPKAPIINYADKPLSSSNLGTSHDVHDDHLGKDLQHPPNNVFGAQGKHPRSSYRRQQTFPRDPSKEHRPSSSSSSNELSNGLTNLNVRPLRHDTMLSETPTLVNERNVTDDDDIFNRLRRFDTVFIVDDTGSMVLAAHEKEPEGPSRWDATKQALGHIIGLAAPKDEDGIDIRFLKSTDLNGNNMKSVEEVMRLVEEVYMFDGRRGGGTFFEEHLKDEISPRREEYRQYFEQHAAYISKTRAARARLEKPQPPKKLNLIVITDGQADDKQEVEDYIVETAQNWTG